MRSNLDLTGADARDSDVAGLASVDRAALASRWTALTGQEPPKRSTPKLLALALAYELQLRSSKMAQVAEKDVLKALRRLASAPEKKSTPRRLAPGARLLREWRGRTLAVDVIDDGFLFEGKRYASLSAIARQATGVARNGPAFFGLSRRGKA